MDVGVVAEARRVVGVLDDVDELEGRAAGTVVFKLGVRGGYSACMAGGVDASDPLPMDETLIAAFSAAAAADDVVALVVSAAEPHLLRNTHPPILPPIPPLVLLRPSSAGSDFLPLVICCPANMPPRYDALALLPPVSAPGSTTSA
jgi:hypothetical protein